MAERDPLDPRDTRNNFLQLFQRVDLTDHRMDQFEATQAKHGELISLLVTLVKGNTEIGHSGLVQQMTDMNQTLQSIKTTQDLSERERENAKNRWKWIGMGLALAAVPGLKDIVELVGRIFTP